MTTSSIESNVHSMSAVVQVFNGERGERRHRCRLSTVDSVLEAWTWPNLPLGEPDEVHIGYAWIMPVMPNGAETVLLRFTCSLDTLLSGALPASLCPIRGAVKGITALIDTIEIPLLREFALRAFLPAPVLEHFWRAPASRGNHHAYPGGLALHARQVAAGAAALPGLDRLVRSFAIVHGRTRDYGKPWQLVESLQSIHRKRSHEAIGSARLQRPLERLREQDETLADVVLELLGGTRSPRESKYPLAILALVNVHDQLRGETERKRCLQRGELQVFWTKDPQLIRGLAAHRPWNYCRRHRFQTKLLANPLQRA